MDLVRVIVAEHLVIAERVDKRKISATEGMAARAELESRIVAELQRRELIMRRAEQDAAEASARAQAQSEASARARAGEEAQAKVLEEMQAQATDWAASAMPLLLAFLQRAPCVSPI